MPFGLNEMENKTFEEFDRCPVCLEGIHSENAEISSVENLFFPQWMNSLHCPCTHAPLHHNTCLWKWYLKTKNYMTVGNVILHTNILRSNTYDVIDTFPCPICRQACLYKRI